MMRRKSMAAPESVPAPAPKAPVCCPVHLRKLPDFSIKEMAYCPLLLHKTPEQLLESLHAAPQFAALRPGRLLKQRRENLRVILLGESDYYIRQAAVYLATLSRLERDLRSPGELPEEAPWEDDLLELFGEEPRDEPPLRDSLAVLSPAMLDPSLNERQEGKSMVLMRQSGPEKLCPAKLDAAAMLIAAPSGPVLTPAVAEELAALLSERDFAQHPLDVFLALRPEQVDLELLDELRFSHGFRLCRVGQPDQDYLRRFLAASAEELLLPLGSQVDLDEIIAHTRRCRGSRFTELDLVSVIGLVIQKDAGGPLRTQDLLFRPFRGQRQGWKELERMVGLAPVKNTLRRLLASAVLEGRRRQAGRQTTPACRNLAFSGPPGTGKSVTARLAAQILREEGCGTGRFVEAGREQLIGSYLGQTSPMVAELFQRARGGVLFIDEAGSLLDSGGHDAYAVEAVNALVRHMELEPETMVIFATYPGEMKRLLASNPGLSSRVAQVLDFGSYDDGQLWEILNLLANKEDRTLPEASQKLCTEFFAALRRRRGERFGNGREARRLFQAAVEELALRVLEGAEDRLELRDLERAAERLLAEPDGGTAQPVGFRTGAA